MEAATLSVTSIVLTEGIKFLYGQAADLLARWRDRKDAAKSVGTERVDVALPQDAFEGQLIEPRIHYEALARVADDINVFRKALLDYAEGEPIGNNVDAVAADTDALRRLIEAVYQQRLTFKGEQRAPSGPVVKGTIDVQSVAGYAAAVRARRIASGSVEGDVRSGDIAPTGTVIGVEAESIGEA
jgi:hypothetical protein